jgi:arginyl-tRNA synthetase
MIRDQLIAALADALKAMGVETPIDSIELERPGRREHGDWSSNVALATSKAAGKNPREFAQQVADHISADPPAHVAAVEIAGPGFVNFRLMDSWLYEVLAATVAEGTGGFGRHTFGEGIRVNVEFVSANPNKPLHAGHARGAVYGDSVARLLVAVGHPVTR